MQLIVWISCLCNLLQPSEASAEVLSLRNHLVIGMLAVDDREVDRSLVQTIDEACGTGSMTAVVDLLNSRGYHAAVVPASLPQLQQRKRPFACLVRFSAADWAVISDVTEQSVSFMRFPSLQSAPRIVVESELMPDCLLISRHPVESLAAIEATVRRDKNLARLRQLQIPAMVIAVVLTVLWIWYRSRRSMRGTT